MDNKEITKEVKFSKAERSALFSLVILLILSYVYSFWYQPQIVLNDNDHKIEDLLTEVPNENQKKYKNKAYKWLDPKAQQKRLYPKPIYESFNPNTIDSTKWIQFGVKSWTIKSIMKYKAKGGQFRTCTDLNKIYNCLLYTSPSPRDRG